MEEDSNKGESERDFLVLQRQKEISLSRNLINFRSKLKYTQGELANLSGVSRVAINEIENKKRKIPSGNTILRLSNALGVKIEDLFKDESNN